ncbi:MAG: hypothetical protein GXX99_02605 [Clostridiales bacterium]|nr:hypothetical protein [Clostridiales bacterium]
MTADRQKALRWACDSMADLVAALRAQLAERDREIARLRGAAEAISAGDAPDRRGAGRADSLRDASDPCGGGEAGGGRSRAYNAGRKRAAHPIARPMAMRGAPCGRWMAVCEVCRSSPCHPRCPHAEPPEPALTCDRCRGALYDGEHYIDLRGERICFYCLYDMDTPALLTLLEVPYTPQPRRPRGRAPKGPAARPALRRRGADRQGPLSGRKRDGAGGRQKGRRRGRGQAPRPTTTTPATRRSWLPASAPRPCHL